MQLLKIGQIAIEKDGVRNGTFNLVDMQLTRLVCALATQQL